jgi:hypothetical protein
LKFLLCAAESQIKKYLFSVSAVALICGDKLFVYTRSAGGEQLKGSSEALVEIKKSKRRQRGFPTLKPAEREKNTQSQQAACRVRIKCRLGLIFCVQAVRSPVAQRASRKVI